MSVAISLEAAMRHALDPVAFATEVLDFHPDPWQRRVLRTGALQVLV
jgi:hypothetical protein